MHANKYQRKVTLPALSVTSRGSACFNAPREAYGTVQLQGKVCTHPECISHAFHSQKKKGLVINQVLLQLYRQALQGVSCMFQMHLSQAADVSRTCSGRMQTLYCTLELSCTISLESRLA